MPHYTESFYKQQRDRSRRSAKEVVPLVLDLIHPRSVIDVGCGVGTWLSVFKEYGVEEVLGVDGHWVNTRMLEIAPERFCFWDLTQPLRLKRTFDLVISLEVAEHLPSACAETFIHSLTSLGPVILFSAAIPYQGGTHHVNEQWPEYWAQYFHERGYQGVDCFRQRFWQNSQVEWFYAQNLFLFASTDYLNRHPTIRNAGQRHTSPCLPVVHPKQYLRTIELMRSLHRVAQDIAAVISAADDFILVDDNYLCVLERQFGVEIASGRRVIPFLEREGEYWGLPQDDATAIEELRRLRGSGAKFIVFAWPSFWWFDYYVEFYRYLSSTFRCVLENERLIVFTL